MSLPDDFRIEELEDAFDANDKRMQEVDAINKELLVALKAIYELAPSDWPTWDEIGKLIAKAEALK